MTSSQNNELLNKNNKLASQNKLVSLNDDFGRQSDEILKLVS